jgi:hypothetical protein
VAHSLLSIYYQQKEAHNERRNNYDSLSDIRFFGMRLLNNCYLDFSLTATPTYADPHIINAPPENGAFYLIFQILSYSITAKIHTVIDVRKCNSALRLS